MAAPSVTNTFTNGTTSDATAVNTNFTDLIDCMSDGTTDFTIGTISVAGAATFNGNVTLGNSSVDDITITGSLAASIAVKTTATYNVGSSTSGLLSVYLGNGSYTTRLLAGTLTESYTITLPVADPDVTGKTMVFGATGAAEFRYPGKATAVKTSAYTATGDETVILCDASSAAFTVTLPAAATYTGKEFTIVRVDNTYANALTIDGNASETIGGSTTYAMYTINERLTIISDGSNWRITRHDTDTGRISYTPTGTLSTNTTWTGFWRRIGQEVYVEAKALLSGSPGATGTITVDTPTGMTIDTSLIVESATVLTNHVGEASFWDDSASVSYQVRMTYNSSTSAVGKLIAVGGTYAAPSAFSNTVPVTMAANDFVLMKFSAPISGWNP